MMMKINLSNVLKMNSALKVLLPMNKLEFVKTALKTVYNVILTGFVKNVPQNSIYKMENVFLSVG